MTGTEKIDELYKEAQKYSFYRFVIKNNKYSLYYWAPRLTLLAAYVLLSLLVFTYRSWGLAVSCLLFLILANGLYELYKKKVYRFFLNDPRIKGLVVPGSKLSIKECKEILTKYETQQIIIKAKHLNIKTPDKIDTTIQIIESDGIKLRDFNWLPITILILLLIPIWGEYIGFRFNAILLEAQVKTGSAFEDLYFKGAKLPIFTLMPLAVFIMVPLWGIAYVSREYVLRNVHKKLKLVKILRYMKLQ